LTGYVDCYLFIWQLGIYDYLAGYVTTQVVCVHFSSWKPEFNPKVVELGFTTEKVSGFSPSTLFFSYHFSFHEYCLLDVDTVRGFPDATVPRDSVFTPFILDI
jgi:hypothetical protein